MKATSQIHNFQNPQIFELITPNLFSRYSLIIFLLPMIPLLAVLTGCKEDYVATVKTSLSLKEDIASNNVVTCPTFENDECVLPDCKTGNSNNCIRQDLDPCDYDNMLEYAEAVVCVLNKFVNGCPYYEQQFGEGCVKYTDCVALNSVSMTMESLESGFNPWVYCSTADCSSYTCSGIIHLHRPITIAYQNAMMAEARSIILSLFANSCECPVQIGRLDFYVCNNPSVSCSTTTSCFNSRIHVKVEYWCCPTCY
jgi:hypothetical protein